MNIDLPQVLDLARKWQQQAVTIFAIMMSDSFRWDVHYEGRVSVTEDMIELTPENSEAVAHMKLLPNCIERHCRGYYVNGTAKTLVLQTNDR